MKKAICLICVLIALAFETFSQNFAPIGTIWYYDYISSEAEQGYARLSALKDTIVDGKSYRLIERYYEGYFYQSTPPQFFSYTKPPLLIYQLQDSIFLRIDDKDVIIHRINAKVGEEWETRANIHEGSCGDTATITIVNVGEEVINGVSHKFFETFNDDGPWEYAGKTYEVFGNQDFILPHPSSACNTEFAGETRLRCYSDPNVGLVKFTEKDCDVISSIEEKGALGALFFDYNSGQLFGLDEVENLKLYGLDGKLVLNTSVTSSKLPLNIPSGFYVVHSLMKNGSRKSIKIQIP